MAQTTTNLSNLKIHYLGQEDYDALKPINQEKNALYITPEKEYPVGSVISFSDNISPDLRGYPGTWQLIHKMFKRTTWHAANADIEGIWTWNNTNTQNTRNVMISREGNRVDIRLGFGLKAAVSDSTVVLGSLNIAKIGFLSFYTSHTCALNDAANAIGLVNTTNNQTGILDIQVIDWVTRAASYPTSTGNACQLQLSLLCYESVDDIIDDACDVFMFKRVE